MRQRRLPIMPTLVAAYRDLGHLLTAMRALMLSGAGTAERRITLR